MPKKRSPIKRCKEAKSIIRIKIWCLKIVPAVDKSKKKEGFHRGWAGCAQRFPQFRAEGSMSSFVIFHDFLKMHRHHACEKSAIPAVPRARKAGRTGRTWLHRGSRQASKGSAVPAAPLLADPPPGGVTFHFANASQSLLEHQSPEGAEVYF